MMSFWVVPCERGAVDAVLVGDGDVEAEQPGRGGVDRHRRVHLVERDAVEQRVHVALVGDRDADLADLAAGEDVVGVIAGLGRQVEGDREPRLALGEVAPVELVRSPGVRMPGVGAHHPGAIGFGRRCSLMPPILPGTPVGCRDRRADRHHAPRPRPGDRRPPGPRRADRRPRPASALENWIDGATSRRGR